MGTDQVAAALDEVRRFIGKRDELLAGRLLAAVEAVLALHPADKDEDYPREQPLCPACSEWWPCDTIRAVSRALLGEGGPDSGDSDIQPDPYIDAMAAEHTSEYPEAVEGEMSDD